MNIGRILLRKFPGKMPGGYMVVSDDSGRQRLGFWDETAMGRPAPTDGMMEEWEKELPSELDEVKAEKKRAIDAATSRIRDRDGLAYGGGRFAMHEGAMLKWTGMMAAQDLLPFPFTILTIDDKPFILQDRQALSGFLVAVMAYEAAPDSPLVAGRALRMRVEAARTVAEVEAVVDDR